MDINSKESAPDSNVLVDAYSLKKISQLSIC